MQLVITPEESAVLDAAAADRIEALMERAGLWVALAAIDMGIGYGSRVMVLAGPGNNGGDAYVAAKYLARRGVSVLVHARGFPKGDFSAARKASTAAIGAGVRVRPFGEPTPADL
ncbi:MAG: bifunctional ADP-dependent NAD(P)H-hydrate dehydratase/NAD(P)H-hydrate epimerase, partial [Acidimicrobiia bacterium]|nr:bifunctional ADP-dependent NAD(P)H-hydrate dehydratase/NAD(P)H-hydrate epimerase [Acidimicrobiia bacterium]